MPEKYEYSREAAKITLAKVSSWEELNAATLQEAEKKFKEKTKELWREFAISGVLQFDQKEGKQVLKPFTDLDGKCALGILKEAGIDTSRLTYVKPGEYLKGAINLDTGDKFGVVYEEPTYTAYFDHHAPGTTEVTSTTEIMYKAMVDLGMIEKSEAMDRVVDFVTKIDNRKFPPAEFLRSPKTILGLQRDLDFDKLLAYFKEHKSPTEELTPEQLEKYGLKEASLKQQEIVNENMKILRKMEKEGKIIDTFYGKVVFNENNELKAGASAAYVRYDGIINFTPAKSFAVTFKEKNLDEERLKQRLGDKFQGKIIRGKMWIYNEKEPLKLDIKEIIDALKSDEHFKEGEIERKIDYIKKQIFLHGKAINKLIKKYPKIEVGGYIINNKIVLPEKSHWKEDSVIGKSYEEERKLAEEGAISFHSHPGDEFLQESANDILAAYYRFSNIIFGKKEILILVAEKKLPIEKIQEIDKEAWKEAIEEQERSGDLAYWIWKELLQKELPVRLIALKKSAEATAEISFSDLPESYKTFYVFKEGKFVNSEYTQTVIHKNDNCEIPPLVLANNPDEIKESKTSRYGMPNYEGYYDEKGFPHTTYEYGKGLENYYFFINKNRPIYVFDNHLHALFAWQEAKEAGLLGDKVALIRFDAHLDSFPCRSFEIKSRKNIKEAIVDDILNVKNFTEPALRSSLISKMYYCSGLKNKDITKIAESQIQNRLIFNPEWEAIKDYASQGKLEDISKESIESPEFLLQLMEKLKKEGYDIILDIDFDVFRRQHAIKFLKILPALARKSQLITCATSPLYSKQTKTIKLLKRFLKKIID